ncbi:hypothetical protein ACFLU6_00840, partial [Acidobacteriota bacterium]
SQIRAMTGAHTRFVWAQDAGEKSDPMGERSEMRLIGFDTDDSLGERPVLSEISNYTKPMLTPKGDRIVFSNRSERTVYVVNWDGSGLQKVADGFAADVWRDPESGVEWVYLVRNYRKKNTAPCRRVMIDNPKRRQRVWEKLDISYGWFGISADGTRAAAACPWPECGLARLPNLTWKKYGKGCLPDIAPDNSYLFWIFDGPHRNLYLYGEGIAKGRRISINNAPGIEGHEVYHPRWSNHVHFMTMTGPFMVGNAKTRVPAGGKAVEIYLGKFDTQFASIEDWIQITRNDRGDFYPDAWIEGGSESSIPPAVKEAFQIESAGRVADTEPASTVVLQGRLQQITVTPEPKLIAPYRRALVVYGYEVEKVFQGRCDEEEILVAHWAIRDGKILPGLQERKAGGSFRLVLERFDDHPQLQSERLIMDTEDYSLPLFYDIEQ